MFYRCENLEYINIKNFDEKDNMNIDEMFDNIPPNAVICFLSCLPPKNFIIDSMNTAKVTISWEENEYNKFIISYGLQNLSNPNDGDKINITDRTSYTFTNLNSNQKYNIYIKTDCESKSSYWLGPLLISFESYNMAGAGTNSIITCSKVIYDSGGPSRNYVNNENSELRIYPQSTNKLLYITGFVYTERNSDILSIYNGKDNLKYYSLLGKYSGYINVPLSVINEGYFTLKFTSDSGNTYPGFQLTVGCIIYSQPTIYSLIKDKRCFKISCDDNWKNIQIVSVSCIQNCQLTSTKYQYRGICYNRCPEGTVDIRNNYFCYLENVAESCESYSLASELENACLKCKNGYYTIFNDINNKNDFIHCYKNNSLEKYYLDNNDLLFKPCNKACKTCELSGTTQNSNCLSCDTS